MGIFGTEKGRFFQLPSWVDLNKPPGMTYVTPGGYPSQFWPWLKNIFSLKYFWNSPNSIWCFIAVLMYLLFPYDLEAAKVWNAYWVVERLVLNVTVVWIYYGFWYVTLNRLGWSQRKFKPNEGLTWTGLFHNVYYTTLGAVQWTGFEVIFMHLWATGKLPYIKDEDLFSLSNITKLIGYTLAVPLWRDFHFYFAHRFLHIRCLYIFVHSFHHRNVDIEPFSGMCMHPIEHLYYFSCVAPSVYLLASPFHLLWNGIHLILSPAASHSGWEDHWQSDQFHYLHHAKFECNYGTGGIPFDFIFDTARLSFDPKAQSSYKGGASNEEIEKLGGMETFTKVDAEYKAKYIGFKSRTPFSVNEIFPKFKDGIYFVFTIFIYGVLVHAIVHHENVLQNVLGYLIAMLVSFGPVAFGMLLLLVTGDKYSWRFPFHKERLFGNLGVHMIISFMVCIIPVYHIITALFLPVLSG